LSPRAKGGRRHATGALHSRTIEKSIAAAKTIKTMRFVMLFYMIASNCVLRKAFNILFGQSRIQ
jgi:hypothetical protein